MSRILAFPPASSSWSISFIGPFWIVPINYNNNHDYVNGKFKNDDTDYELNERASNNEHNEHDRPDKSFVTQNWGRIRLRISIYNHLYCYMQHFLLYAALKTEFRNIERRKSYGKIGTPPTRCHMVRSPWAAPLWHYHITYSIFLKLIFLKCFEIFISYF